LKKHHTAISIHFKEFLFLLGFYVSLALFYYTTLWLNRGGFTNSRETYFSLMGILNWGGLDYFLKFILSLPVFWLIFAWLSQSRWLIRLLVHCLTLPLFVFCWIKLYYAITDALHLFHLQGLGSLWDIYITALFYILQFGIIHAYMYFKENQQQMEVEAILRESALKSELSALKAQLNPHFLYNVFNTINASIPKELEQTREIVADLSDLFRYQLQASQSDLVKLKEELDFTIKYLSLEKARFNERLQIHVEVDPILLDRKVPPMIIQPIVENAVKHGIAPRVEGGNISILIQSSGEKIKVCICDNGMGNAEIGNIIGMGTGLSNTDLRLKKMFGNGLEITPTMPHGLTVKFTLD